MDILFQSENDGIKVLRGTSTTNPTFEIKSFADYLMTSTDDSNCQD